MQSIEGYDKGYDDNGKCFKLALPPAEPGQSSSTKWFFKRALEASALYIIPNILWFLISYLGYLEILQAIILTALLMHAYCLGVSIIWTRRVWKEARISVE